MVIPAGSNYTVEVEQTRDLGTTYVVRAYKKILGFRKTLSSDWFLDREQAHTFAEQLAQELKNGKKVDSLRERKPGWTLHRPAH